MDNFLTWESLTTYASFVSIIYMVVEFTKDLPLISKVPTKYWSFFISIILLSTTNWAIGVFVPKDIVLYILTSVSISLGANGLSNFNNKKEGKDK